MKLIIIEMPTSNTADCRLTRGQLFKFQESLTAMFAFRSPVIPLERLKTSAINVLLKCYNLFKKNHLDNENCPSILVRKMEH